MDSFVILKKDGTIVTINNEQVAGVYIMSNINDVVSVKRVPYLTTCTQKAALVYDLEQYGTYANPIQIPENGMNVQRGKWYYTNNRLMPHMATYNEFIERFEFDDKFWFEYPDL